MRDDFCAFILTHGRANNVLTYSTLRRSGYTGKIYLVIDDKDPQEQEYRKRYGDKVLQFSKRAVAEYTDVGDNYPMRNVVLFARNVCWELARQVNVRYFVQLDDDYTSFQFRGDGIYLPDTVTIRKTLDDVFELIIEFLEKSGATSIALSQGGDHIGGVKKRGTYYLHRKAMNSFFCSVERPFLFFGRLNEDVNTYVTLGNRGHLFFTIMQCMLKQIETQQQSGGLTEAYLELGTYTKSFYTVMYAPSCTQVSILEDHASPHPRLHHRINWNSAVPKIIKETYRKPRVPKRDKQMNEHDSHPNSAC